MVHKVAVIVDPKAFTVVFDKEGQIRDALLSQIKTQTTQKGAEVVELRTTRGQISTDTKRHRWATALSKPLKEAKANGDTLSYVIIGSTKRFGIVEATDALQEVLHEDTNGVIKSVSVMAQNSLTGSRQPYMKDAHAPIKLSRDNLSKLSVSQDVPRYKDLSNTLNQVGGPNDDYRHKILSYEQAVRNLAEQELITIPVTDNNSDWIYKQDFFNWLGNAITVNQQAA